MASIPPLRRLVFLALLALACSREPERPPVIILSIDTLRADRLARMPNLERFAADAITFDSAWTHAPLTLPAHASLMTGLLPPEHGVRDNAGFRLGAKLPTIATMLRARGYATGGAVSAYVLRRDSGIASGFDVFDDAIEFVEGAPTGSLHRRGSITIANALRWLDGQTEKPPFLFVHLFEPHTPYEPTYDADVLAADRLAGEFFDELRARKLYDDALIVVLSDHGEGLNDHGEEEHGILLYREALQVPLLVKLPRNARKATRAGEPVQLIDVLPTIAQLTQATPPPNLRGRSLLDKPIARALYGETLYPRIHLGWSELRSIVRAPHHLIDGPKPELYRLAADPRETRNIRENERRAFAQLRGDLAAMPQAVASPTINAEEAKKLVALGYLTSISSTRSDKNPRDHLHELDARKEIAALMARHDFASAATKLEALLARNPGWSDLRDDLGLAYERLNRLPDAEGVYREAIRATPELAQEVALSLAGVLLRQGKLDEAAQHARVAAERSTQPKAARLMLAEIQALRRDLNGALEILRQIEPPYPPRYHFLLGDVLGSLGRTGEAIRAFETELRVAPRDTEAKRRLALLYRIREGVGAR
ncbi:MAG TPA: sulfatase-like hydrolase/transferase [Thermoanaerobaculia bacterium]|jgi:arylsulfatase A-like enzyme/thioredoxin-like negative regulator of GroEL